MCKNYSNFTEVELHLRSRFRYLFEEITNLTNLTSLHLTYYDLFKEALRVFVFHELNQHLRLPLQRHN